MLMVPIGFRVKGFKLSYHNWRVPLWDLGVKETIKLPEYRNHIMS